MRRLELAAGASRWQGGRHVWSTNEAMRHAERELALQAQRAYERTVKGAMAHLAEPVETSALRGRKRRAKTDREDARWLRELLADGRLPEA